MGRWAVDQLTRRLGLATGGPVADGAPVAAAEEPAAHVVLPVRLVIRGSTGPAPAA
jgi:hypothetical protein